MEEQTHVIIKMGFLCTLAVIGILVAAWLVSRWDANAAYRMLEHSQHFFEPEVDSPMTPVTVRTHSPGNRGKLSPGKRQWISPLVKKRIAAKQKWRCAICKQLLDETFELDHIRPLFKGGDPTDERNLQCLCKRDHMLKSALEQVRSP